MDKRFQVAVKCSTRTRSVAGVVLALLLAVPTLAREQLTIQKSATNTQVRAADTFLDQANPTNTNGSSATLQVQSFQSATAQNQRSIVQFDFSVLPNAGIKNAQLSLHVVTPPASSRTYEAHNVTSFFTESDASWNIRAAGVAWGAAGGDFNGTATSTFTITNATTTATWDITADVQNWYRGTANYGTLIKDSAENNASAVTTVFSSKETSTLANAPQVQLTYVQNVSNLTATAGNASVALTWTMPTQLTGSTLLEDYMGVVILRRTNLPPDKFSTPADGTTPALGATLGNGCVIFISTLKTVASYTDNAANTTVCGGAPANNTMYFYKVFAYDTAHNYSTSGAAAGGASVFTSEISGMPSTTTPNSSVWIAATFSTTLAAPAVLPGSVVMDGSQSSQLFTINASTGFRKYPSISLGGSITGRSPVIDSGNSSLAQNVVYVAGQDSLIYAVATDTGQILWVKNPTGAAANLFQGAPSVVVKNFSGGTYIRTTDLVVAGTHNGGTTTGNQVVALDGNTGATVWQKIGNAGGVPAMDIISSTPEVDYSRNAIWVTSHANGGTGQPSLWKFDANTGAVLATQNLNDIDSSPTLTDAGDVLFVGTNLGVLYAINPVTGAQLARFPTAGNGADGAIRGFPAVVNFTSPYQVVFSTTGHVQMVTFNTLTNTFSAATVWQTAITAPSSPLGFAGLSTIYVGSSDGRIYELAVSNGATKQRVCNTGQPGIVGDVTLDTGLMRVYASTTDQRMYGFTFPF